MRWLECGSPGSMISQGSDLFRFCFPHMTPSVEEIQQKLMQVSNAIGLFPDLTQKTNVSQLVDFDKASGPGDPALYAPISRDSTDLNPDNVAESATSAPQRILNEAYDCIYGLHAKKHRAPSARPAGGARGGDYGNFYGCAESECAVAGQRGGPGVAQHVLQVGPPRAISSGRCYDGVLKRTPSLGKTCIWQPRSCGPRCGPIRGSPRSRQR